MSTNQPSEVTEQLHVSNIRIARTCEKDEYDAVVTVCQDSIEANVPDGTDYHHFCMADGDEEGHVPGDSSYEMFGRAATTVTLHLLRGDTVLLHCHKGQSRSVAVAMAALMSADDFTFAEAWKRLADERSLFMYPRSPLRKYAERFADVP